MHIALSPQLEKIVDSKVKSGKYRSPKHIFEKSLELLFTAEEQQERADTRPPLSPEAIASIERGIEDIKNGRCIPHEQVKSHLKKLIENHIAHQK